MSPAPSGSMDQQVLPKRVDVGRILKERGKMNSRENLYVRREMWKPGGDVSGRETRFEGVRREWIRRERHKERKDKENDIATCLPGWKDGGVKGQHAEN